MADSFIAQLDELILASSPVLEDVDVNSLDDEDAVGALARLNLLTKNIANARFQVEQYLCDLHTAGTTVQVPGVGQAIIETKGKVRTLGTKLAAHLIAQASDAPCNEDGEPLPPAAIAERTGQLFTIVFGLDNASQSFRATEVKKLGWKPGEFQEWSDGQPKVRFIDGAA